MHLQTQMDELNTNNEDIVIADKAVDDNYTQHSETSLNQSEIENENNNDSVYKHINYSNINDINVKDIYVHGNPYVNEPATNIRTNIRGADIRCTKNPYNHLTPKALDVTTMKFLKSVDIDGYPYKLNKTYPYIGAALSKAEYSALIDENKDVAKPFQREHLEEYNYYQKARRARQTDINWIKYIFGCGPMPGNYAVDPNEWHMRKEMNNRRIQTIDKPQTTVHLMSSECQEARNSILKLVMKNNTISVENALFLSYIWNFKPTKEDINMLRNRPLSAKAFSSWLEKICHSEDLDTNIFMNPFFVYDENNTGKINHFLLKTLLCNYGEPLTDEEFDKCSTKFELNKKIVDYKELIEDLITLNNETIGISAYRKFNIKTHDIPKNHREAVLSL